MAGRARRAADRSCSADPLGRLPARIRAGGPAICRPPRSVSVPPDAADSRSTRESLARIIHERLRPPLRSFPPNASSALLDDAYDIAIVALPRLVEKSLSRTCATSIRQGPPTTHRLVTIA